MADLISNRHGAKIFSKLDLLKGVFSSSSLPQRHTQDSSHHTLWDLHIQLLHFWSSKFRGNLSAPNRWHPQRPSLLHLLCGQHTDLLQELRGTSPTSPNCSAATTGQRPVCASEQMPVWRYISGIPWTPDIIHQCLPPFG